MQFIEFLAEGGAPGFAHPQIRDGTALVVPHGEVIAVRDQVVGGLEPVGVAAGLPEAGIGAFPDRLALHQHQRVAGGCVMDVGCEVQQVRLDVMLPHAFPHHEAEPGRFLLLAVAQLPEKRRHEMHLHLTLRPQMQPCFVSEPFRRWPRLRRRRGPYPRCGDREDQPVIASSLLQGRLHHDALVRQEFAHHLSPGGRPGLEAEEILEPVCPQPPRTPPAHLDRPSQRRHGLSRVPVHSHPPR
jgi:hypothetical protein